MQILVENYNDTKQEYDALSSDDQKMFDDVLGAVADAFKSGDPLQVELQLNALTDASERFENLN